MIVKMHTGSEIRGESFMLGAGIEPAWEFIPRDFKSLASTGFATRAETDEPTGIVAQRPKRSSGKRDSNPRPQPWQGCALPTELFPQTLTKLPVPEEANKRRASSHYIW
jgi:hypothetical protein